MDIRPYRPGDTAALQRICIATGDLGDPADHLYQDPALLHLVYLDPYLELEPALAVIAADAGGPAGYVVGTADTVGFYDRWAAEWSPRFTATHPDPADGDTPDDRLRRYLHHPHRGVPTLVDRYPAHLHVDLLPPARGRGIGRTLLHLLFAALADRGAAGLFVGVSEGNLGARAFYRTLGFRPTDDPGILARSLD